MHIKIHIKYFMKIIKTKYIPFRKSVKKYHACKIVHSVEGKLIFVFIRYAETFVLF